MSCKICDGIKEKSLNVIYEDDIVVAVLPEDGCAEGHIEVYPKKHCKEIGELSDEETEHLFYTASYGATAVFEFLGAQGTNIICDSGLNEHLCINVIARKEDDGLDFLWKPEKQDEGAMKDAEDKIRDHTFMIGKDEKGGGGSSAKTGSSGKAKSSGSGSEGKLNRITDKDKENYLIENLRRIP